MATGIHITVGHRFAQISPAPRWLDYEMQYATRELRFDAGRASWSTVTATGARRDGDRLEVPAGAVPRLVAALQRQRHDVTVDDRRQFGAPRYVVDTDFSSQLRPSLRALADQIIAHPGAVIPYHDPRELREQVAMVCALFGRTRTLVVVPTKACVASLQSDLAPHFGAQVLVVPRGPLLERCRIGICTDARSSHVDPADWDVVLMPFVDRLVQGERIRRDLGTMDRHRIYGWAPEGITLDRRAILTLERLVGPSLNTAATDAWTPIVRVECCEFQTSSSHVPTDALERKRRLWHDAERNQLIADLAGALAAGEPAPLWNLGLLLERDSIEPHAVVVVLTESPEHGRELLRHLPTWQLVTADALAASPQLHLAGSTGRCGAIVTLAAATKLTSLPSGALLRADAGAASLGPLAAKVHGGFVRGELLVVDLVDGDDLAAARRRFDDYRAAGYHIDRDVPRDVTTPAVRPRRKHRRSRRGQ